MAAKDDELTGVSITELDRIVAGTHHDPHSVLGAHPEPGGGVAIRALRPLATSVTVVLTDGSRYPAEHVHQGIFAAVLPKDTIPDYRLAVTYPGGDGAPGTEILVDDPYRHLPSLGDIDLHLIGEGRHEELWRVLGAHVRHYGGGGPDGAQQVPAQAAVTGGPARSIWVLGL